MCKSRELTDTYRAISSLEANASISIQSYNYALCQSYNSHALYLINLVALSGSGSFMTLHFIGDGTMGQVER